MASVRKPTGWRSTYLVDRDGDKISTLADDCIDVGTDESMFGTEKEDRFGRRVDGRAQGPDHERP